MPAPADGVPWPAQLFGTVVSAEAAALLALLRERLARAGALPADGQLDAALLELELDEDVRSALG